MHMCDLIASSANTLADPYLMLYSINEKRLVLDGHCKIWSPVLLNLLWMNLLYASYMNPFNFHIFYIFLVFGFTTIYNEGLKGTLGHILELIVARTTFRHADKWDIGMSMWALAEI